jgi:molybdenum cofactor cytidylyltransferase
MKVRQALNVQRGDIVAFVGAGGKTSALFRLGAELADEGWRVLATTTNRIAANDLTRAPGVLDVSVGLRPSAVSRALTQHNFVYLYSRLSGERAIGLSLDQISTLSDTIDSDVTLIEADSAHGLPFKAPFGNEPGIPHEASLVVPMVGFDVLGKPLDDEHVYNARAMVDYFGYPPGERVKAPWVASVLREDDLGLRNVPPNARIIPMINKVLPTGYQRGRARLMARLMLVSPRIAGVAIGSVQHDNPVYEVRRRVAAIVLAGGLSSRMGQLKVLMDWDGRPIINAICDKLRRARVEQTVIVTGHKAAYVRAAVAKEGVTVVHNQDYAKGDMLSSLQTGLRALSPEISAALVCLGDQPQLDVRVAYDVMTAYAEGRGLIIAPSYEMRRGHPILLDRAIWPEILELPPDAAPRDVINKHAELTAYVSCRDDSILRDIDTPEDYERERRLAGLV